MTELCLFYLFDQIRRGNALAVHLRNTSGGLVLLDDPLDLLQVSAQQVTGDGVLKCTDGITVFQCPLVLAGMCQQSVEDTGDISVTASDAVYDFDIGVRCFLIIGIILGTVDNGAEGMTLRAMYDTLCGCHDGDWILLREALHNALGIAFLQESQACGVLGAEEDVHIRQNEFDAFLRLGAGPQVPTEVHIEGDDGPLCFKALDHLNSGSSQLRAESRWYGSSGYRCRSCHHSHQRSAC